MASQQMQLSRPTMSQLAMPLGVLILVGTILLPMPPVMLDIMLTLNLSGSIVLLLAVMFSDTPLSLTVFPTLLLLTTAFRLAMNIASTRLILGNGSGGTGAAGHVIEALGVVVVQGNFVVGLILFGVIMVIQYVVINHGAVRISEVSARFVLDAMPGKQMAIDADLNAGLIDENDARVRRLHVTREAEFYGAMDGSIKFTQRDAIAGLIIVAINIVGGLIIGIAQGGMQLAEAFTTFTTLTIGDGLANAIPSLLISIAAGLLTTRASAESHVGTDVAGQLLKRPAPLWAASALLGILSLAPGIPTFAFMLLAGALGLVARRTQLAAQAEAAAPPTGADAAPPPPEPLEKLVAVDRLAIELGFQLLPLVSGGDAGMTGRLKALRRELASSMGLVLPMVRITDSPSSPPNSYSFLLKGAAVARGELMMGHLLVIDAGTGAPLPAGVVTRDPAFHMPAVWVRESQRATAEAAGHMVIDPLTVLVTHFSEVIKSNGHELLGRQEVKSLIDMVAETHPKVVEELTPKLLTVGEVQKVLSALLRERVPIRDLVTTFEVLADMAPIDKNTARMTAEVRVALRRLVVTPYLSEGGELFAVTTGPELEHGLLSAVEGASDPAGLPSPTDLIARIQRAMGSRVSAASPVLLTSPRLRAVVRALIEPYLPSLAVISHAELPPGVRVVSLGMVT